MQSIFKQTPFDHETIKRFIVAFGQIFDGLSVVKRDNTGKIIQRYDVPIEHGPKNKWISRLREQPDLTSGQVKITLPRMSFEIVDIQYDPKRKIGMNGTYAVGSINGQRGKIYNPVPYDVVFQLHTYCKDQTDAQQIIEQIVPYFQPYLTMNFEILPQYKIHKDVPILFNSYQQVDTYDTGVNDFRFVQQTITFVAQMDFFGPLITSSAIIKDVIIKLGENDGTPIEIIDTVVNPITANKEDAHTVDTTITHL